MVVSVVCMPECMKKIMHLIIYFFFCWILQFYILFFLCIVFPAIFFCFGFLGSFFVNACSAVHAWCGVYEGCMHAYTTVCASTLTTTPWLCVWMYACMHDVQKKIFKKINKIKIIIQKKSVRCTKLHTHISGGKKEIIKFSTNN